MLTRKEFNLLVLLYAASIDGKIQEEELEMMLEKTDSETIRKIKKRFLKMSDMEMLDCIRERKDDFLATSENRQQLLDDIHAIINSDDHLTSMESHLMRVIEDLLK